MCSNVLLHVGWGVINPPMLGRVHNVCNLSCVATCLYNCVTYVFVQADVCHAYQIFHARGIPDDHIIVMMFNDIAYNEK